MTIDFNKNEYLLGQAISIASSVHQDQLDKGGRAYILHPIRLMMRLRTTDPELMMIAILHDTIEDSNGSVTIDILRTRGFSERVLNALSLLTHSHEELYDAYIRRVATNKDATLVKLEDLRDNSDITRLKDLRQKDFDRMEKYHRAFMFLKMTMEAMAKVGY